LALAPSVPAEPSLVERFADPPAEARIIKIIHGWPDQPEAQDQLRQKLQAQGFGGVVCNVSFDQYLESDAKWQAFVRAVNEAKKAGMALWLYDERGYPSGNAGGLVLRDHPEWEARGLLVADQECGGAAVSLALPPGKPVFVGALPLQDGVADSSRRLDLTDRVRGGRLDWQAPAGRWRVLAITESRLYEGTHADGNLHEKMPYVNLLERAPTARFLEVTHERYARYLGSDLGRHFVATFTDEPSLMSCFLKPMPYRPLPWSPDLPGEFQRRRGHPLDTSVILSLATDTGAPDAKHRHDFWLTIGELVSENFFGQIQECCRRLGVPSGGHLLMEEGLVAHVPLYGDFFRCIRRLDAPSIDCLTSLPAEVPWYIARLLASAAELEGKPIVMCETSDHGQVYRPAGDARPKRIVTEAEIRGTCNRLIVSGVNAITSYYSFAGLEDDQLRRLNEWVGRCCLMLTGGHQVADIAVVYPAESLWTRFTPSRVWANEAATATRIENLYRSAADSLFNARREFTFVDSRALMEAKVESETLVHGSLRWRVLVLPGVDTLPLAAWENLGRFVEAGGVAIALGALPANSEREFPAPQVRALSDKIFGSTPNEPRPRGGVSAESRHPAKTASGVPSEPQVRTNQVGGAGIFLPAGSEGLLPLVLDGVLAADVKVADPRAPVRVTHRRLANHEVYFVINDSVQPWSGSMDFAAGRGERWDPATGRMAEAVAGGPVQLALAPYGAALFRFAESVLPRRRAIAGGSLPNLSLKPVPRVEPTLPHGEFVRSELTRDESSSTPEVPAWQATGTLTKSQVDTFLFAQFHYAQPLDLSVADCLAIESWVPSGQKTPSRLLVILHEDGGGDFLADTGRSLSGPGHERSYVPLSRFQHAGWSKDEDGVLDAKRVTDIRIGWGGYLGTEGEKVRFSVALPQAGAIRNPGR
jgi:hypothetical protein